MCYTIIYQLYYRHSTRSCLFIHARTLARPHACTPARLNHSTLQSNFVHAKILSCARPHARTMQSYKARLLYPDQSHTTVSHKTYVESLATFLSEIPILIFAMKDYDFKFVYTEPIFPNQRIYMCT